jgi:hypothetical protein
MAGSILIAEIAPEEIRKQINRSIHLWLANCYRACRRACSIVAFCPRVGAD